MTREVCKFVWYELNTTDLDAAQSFYQKVIGWTMADAGMGGSRYTLASAGTNMVAGLMAINDEMRARGVRPCWIGYVAVSDVDAYALQAIAGGGSTCVPPTDIPTVGRFAVMADPYGAVFVLFKPTGTGGDAVAPMTPGHVGWHELQAGDREGALNYYTKLFGWTKAHAHDMGPMGIYQMFATGGEPVGGMMTKLPEVPMSWWLYYFNVASTKATVERIATYGGKLLSQPMQVPSGAWVVQAQDPQGAYFAVVGGP